MIRTTLALLAAATSMLCMPSQAAQFKELFEQGLKDYPGKEGLMLEVTYAPGEVNVAHRHDAYAFPGSWPLPWYENSSWRWDGRRRRRAGGESAAA